MADEEKQQITAMAEITATDDEQHIIEGYASTFKPMRNGYLIPKETLIKALALYLENPVLLLNHDINQPVGKVIDAKIDDRGLWIKAKILDEEVYQKIKEGLLGGLSVGGQGRIVPVDETGLKHVIDFDMYEISVVSVPADAGALIEVVSYVAPVVNNPYSLSDSWDWDWSKDANAIIEKFGWEGLARACAYVEKDGDKLPEKKEAYHLPHHKIIDGKLTLVYGGVVSALRRLPQTNISDTAKEQARKHLEAHLEFLKSKMQKNDTKNGVNADTVKSVSASDIIKIVEQPMEVNKHMEEIVNKVERLEETVEQLQKENEKIVNALKRHDEMKNDVALSEAMKDPMVVADALRLAFAKDLHMDKEVKPVYPIAEKLTFAYLEGTDTAGGMLVLPEYDKTLYTHVVEHSPLLSQFETQTHKSPKYIKFFAKDSNGNIVMKPTATRIDVSTIESTGIGEVAYMQFASEEGVIRAFAGYFDVSLFLIKDLPSTYDFINTAINMLAVGVRNSLDAEIVSALVGLGSSDGIVYYEDTAVPTLDTMRLWIAQQIADGWGDLVWVMSPNTENYYFTLKDANNQYYFGGPIDTVAHRIWNVPVVVDNNVPDDDILLISRTSSIKLHRMEGIQVEVNQQAQDLWRKYMAEYRYITRWDYEILYKPSILRFHKTSA